MSKHPPTASSPASSTDDQGRMSGSPATMSTPATAELQAPTPDHVPCRHNCGVTISWDEICWTHDDTGLAECGIRVVGGTPLGDALVDPAMIRTREPQTRAEPVGAWS